MTKEERMIRILDALLDMTPSAIHILHRYADLVAAKKHPKFIQLDTANTPKFRFAIRRTSDSESLDSPSEASGGACPRRRPEKKMTRRRAARTGQIPCRRFKSSIPQVKP